MPHEVIMPALGMAQQSGQLVAWLKAPGDAVKAGEPLMEVETDKATMEVEAQADGYLGGLRAKAGDDVPVGAVVAVIAESQQAAEAEAGGEVAQDAPETASETDSDDTLPEGAEVIMPALGMAQETGQITTWLKEPGDAVGADDILFEVETDKSAVEVPAGATGYLAAILAEPGEEVPVGAPIAIISAEAPANPVRLSHAQKPATPKLAKTEAPANKPKPEKEVAPTSEAAKPSAKPAAAPAPGGRILASPKAKRLAREQGLDLARLTEAGIAQPYHVSDLETLRALPAPQAAAATAPTAQALHLSAEVSAQGFAAFCDWIAEETGEDPDPGALLAGLAASATLSGPVAVSRHGRSRCFVDPARHPLGQAPQVDEDAMPALLIRDLRGSALQRISLGGEAQPVLTLTGSDPLTLTLEADPGQLAPEAALDLITGFAARLDEPLRHLL
ncbi:pyruvate dehydrogenase E2 component (dihydrolipoamide acetyltransferase) [Thioclava sp. ES.031]|uniref:biotin/lipoyl-containing protein n=1 Tax=Thioclava sp. ES.031 TaxID=1798203 RepID=UPI000BF4357B|nr:biotin/lipoyl-containing protein [Thioclava sp. ES.031]PFG64008.1 pyruvate dehydrogenase E2 component (dihydrolipoamide acetyltransferase) [Thioclava sp. ES.031]